MHRWLSIERAAAILEPGAGGHNQAVAKLFEALKFGEITAKATRPSPTHPNPNCSGVTKMSPEFFQQFAFRPRDPAYRSAWSSFALEGGILVKRDAVEEFDRLQPWFDETIALARAGATWRFVHALAWTATESFDVVRSVEIPAPTHQPLKRYAARRALGRLRKIVADSYCRCGSTLTAQNEKWETCACTEQAFQRLRDALTSDQLAGFIQPGNKLLAPAAAHGITLRLERYELAFPYEADEMTFSADQVRSLTLPAVAFSQSEVITEKPILPMGTPTKAPPTDFQICLFIMERWKFGVTARPEAFTNFRKHFGRLAGDRDNVFDPLWKIMTGNRRRGQKAPPPDAPVITGVMPSRITKNI
ncbi:MAG: hypothetical protein ACSLE1_15045 [Sphingobium sp.]